MIGSFDPIATGTDIQRRIGVKTSRDEPLARFTTMRVGGPADLFATVHNAHELRALVRFARTRALPHFVLGRGSDLGHRRRGDPWPGHPGPSRRLAHRRHLLHREAASRWPAPRPRRSGPA
jgi:UDP-N-acetylenolpyruvoylglucosamine reductase